MKKKLFGDFVIPTLQKKTREIFVPYKKNWTDGTITWKKLTSKTECMISHCIDRNVECPKYFLNAATCCGLGSVEDIFALPFSNQDDA